MAQARASVGKEDDGIRMVLLGSEVSLLFLIFSPHNLNHLTLVNLFRFDDYLSSMSIQTQSAWVFEDTFSKTAGLYVWTVKESKLVAWKQAMYSGDFRQEGSYLVLQTLALVKSQPSALTHTIYTWFGYDTSTEDADFISYKAIKLSEYLGTHPQEQRQTQSNESSSFLPLFFPYFLTTLDGLHTNYIPPSCEAPLRSSIPPRLWQISLPLSEKGARHHLKVQEVRAVTSSLTRDNVYILDKGKKLELWNGRIAHPLEKARGLDVGEFWVGTRGGNAILTTFDDDDAFFVELGVSSCELPVNFPPFSPTATPAISSSQAYSLIDFSLSRSSTNSSSSPLPTKFNSNLLIPQAIYLIITLSRSSYYIWVDQKLV